MNPGGGWYPACGSHAASAPAPASSNSAALFTTAILTFAVLACDLDASIERASEVRVVFGYRPQLAKAFRDHLACRHAAVRGQPSRHHAGAAQRQHLSCRG